MSEGVSPRLKEHVRNYGLPLSPGSRAILLSDPGETRAHTIGPQPWAHISWLWFCDSFSSLTGFFEDL